MKRTYQRLTRSVASISRCLFTFAFLRLSVSETRPHFNLHRSKDRIFFLIAALVLGASEAGASWIRWEPGLDDSAGKAVISTDSNPTSDGLPQLFHYQRVNFEAAVQWRAGDSLSIAGDDPTLWVYSVSSDSASPIQLDIRLTHRVGYDSLRLVDKEGAPVMARVLIGDVGTQSDLGKLTYGVRLYSDGKEVAYSDSPGGVDYASPWNMTLHEPADRALVDDAILANASLTGEGAFARPPEGASPSYLCLTSFGSGAPSWDRIVLTFADNTGSGIIKAGTRMRVALSGIPLAESLHTMACTSDPLLPIVMYETERPLWFYVTGIEAPSGNGIARLVNAGNDQLFAPFPERILPLAPELRMAFDLQRDLQAPSSEFLNVSLRADGFTNNQPSAVFVFNNYAATPLEELMDSAWGREPGDWPSEKPMGRPLWESSMSLCEAIDFESQGIGIAAGEGQFYARSINARRFVVGTLEDSEREAKPAIWRQHTDAPLPLSSHAGAAQAANDDLSCQVVGHTISPTGIRHPTLWSEEAEWADSLLPMPAFAIGGSALTINDRGVACGFSDVLVSVTPNRLPCLWAPGAESNHKSVRILPTPKQAISAVARDINRRGVVVGYAEDKSGSRSACRWVPKNGSWEWEDLGIVGEAISINEIGIIVGENDGSPWMWQCGEAHDLNQIAKDSGIELRDVFAIGDLGDIIGATEEGKAFLLTPVTTLGF